jgi:hypothetical protein
MRVHSIGTKKTLSQFRVRLCVLATLAALAAMAGAGAPRGDAQSPASPAAASSVPGAQAQAVQTGAQAKQPGGNGAAEGRNQQIAGDCANLLRLAAALKNEVDRTTKDELSVTVIRRAGEIEQLAHKVKDEMKPVVGKS